MSYSGERDNFAPHMALVPMVIEQTSRGERSFDIYSRLLDKIEKTCCTDCNLMDGLSASPCVMGTASPYFKHNNLLLLR